MTDLVGSMGVQVSSNFLRLWHLEICSFLLFVLENLLVSKFDYFNFLLQAQIAFTFNALRSAGKPSDFPINLRGFVFSPSFPKIFWKVQFGTSIQNWKRSANVYIDAASIHPQKSQYRQIWSPYSLQGRLLPGRLRQMPYISHLLGKYLGFYSYKGNLH